MRSNSSDYCVSAIYSRRQLIWNIRVWNSQGKSVLKDKATSFASMNDTVMTWCKQTMEPGQTTTLHVGSDTWRGCTDFNKVREYYKKKRIAIRERKYFFVDKMANRNPVSLSEIIGLIDRAFDDMAYTLSHLHRHGRLEYIKTNGIEGSPHWCKCTRMPKW